MSEDQAVELLQHQANLEFLIQVGTYALCFVGGSMTFFVFLWAWRGRGFLLVVALALVPPCSARGADDLDAALVGTSFQLIGGHYSGSSEIVTLNYQLDSPYGLGSASHVGVYFGTSSTGGAYAAYRGDDGQWGVSAWNTGGDGPFDDDVFGPLGDGVADSSFDLPSSFAAAEDATTGTSSAPGPGQWDPAQHPPAGPGSGGTGVTIPTFGLDVLGSITNLATKVSPPALKILGMEFGFLVAIVVIRFIADGAEVRIGAKNNAATYATQRQSDRNYFAERDLDNLQADRQEQWADADGTEDEELTRDDF